MNAAAVCQYTAGTRKSVGVFVGSRVVVVAVVMLGAFAAAGTRGADLASTPAALPAADGDAATNVTITVLELFQSVLRRMRCEQPPTLDPGATPTAWAQQFNRSYKSCGLRTDLDNESRRETSDAVHSLAAVIETAPELLDEAVARETLQTLHDIQLDLGELP